MDTKLVQLSDSLGSNIVALATPRGRGAIAIIRLSGPDSHRVVSSVWQPAARKDDLQPGHMYLGWVTVDGDKIDQALVVIQKAPNSYTGEDTAEIHLHGSPAVIDMTLDVCLSDGARLAEPGEFTKRAFLNKRLSASQAEAVADLVAAESQALVRLAADQLAGGLDSAIADILAVLVSVAAKEAAYLDFSEEDIASQETAAFAMELSNVTADLQALLERSTHVPVLRDGLKVALVGLPNTGKSTLLNALVGYDRAITSDEAGTTRDTVEETIILGDVPIRLIDTAGLNANPGRVEAIGIKRTLQTLDSADVVLVLVAPNTQAETDAFLRSNHLGDILSVKPTIWINTKQDQVLNKAQTEKPTDYISLSAKTGNGLDDLKEAITRHALGSDTMEGTLLTTKRQIELVKSALQNLATAQELLANKTPRDIILVELEAAAKGLARLSGTDTNDAMITDMFANFCIGK